GAAISYIYLPLLFWALAAATGRCGAASAILSAPSLLAAFPRALQAPVLLPSHSCLRSCPSPRTQPRPFALLPLPPLPPVPLSLLPSLSSSSLLAAHGAALVLSQFAAAVPYDELFAIIRERAAELAGDAALEFLWDVALLEALIGAH